MKKILLRNTHCKGPLIESTFWQEAVVKENKMYLYFRVGRETQVRPIRGGLDNETQMKIVTITQRGEGFFFIVAVVVCAFCNGVRHAVHQKRLSRLYGFAV